MNSNLTFEGSPTGIARQRINNAAAAGDITVVAGTSGRSVRVYGLRLSAAGATIVQIKDGAGTVLEQFNLAAGGGVRLKLRGTPFYIGTQGNALIVNSSNPVQVDGELEYSNTGA